MKRFGVLAALFLGALALRPQLVGVGPLLPEIDDDLDVSHAVAGLLGTIPVLCMGLFAPPFGVEPESGDPVLRVTRPDCLQNAN